MHGCARSMGAAGVTEGPARQLWPATLASPPSTRRTLMVCHNYSIFPRLCVHLFCVRTHHDCGLAHAWLFRLDMRSPRMLSRKDTNSPPGYCALIFCGV